MRFLIDFFPIVLFVGAYKYAGIYAATGVLMAATVVQTALIYALDKKLTAMHKVTLALVLGFGALTLWLQDERFIKWKPTALYAGFALTLALAMWVWRKNLLAMLLGTQLKLPDPVWARLLWVWVGYFVFMASINGYVAAYFTTDEWVDFKLWGYVFPVVFLLGQGIYIAKHVKQDDTEDSGGAA